MFVQASIVLLLSIIPEAHTLVLPDGVGRLPALGWDSWNAYGCAITEANVMTTVNLMVQNGLKAAGYEYVNLDDCWAVQSGRNSSTGRIIPDPVKFPNGIDGLATQVHNQGLKIGIYSSAGNTTCAGYPGSLGNEVIDAESFSDWGIDYLKYDNCGAPSNYQDEYNACDPDSGNPNDFPNGTCVNLQDPAPPGYDWSTSNTSLKYQAMADALRDVKRTILFALCDWGLANVNEWGANVGSSWRMSYDIRSYWYRVAVIANMNSFLMNSVNFWGHTDADILQIGNGNLTLAESRYHFALWAAMKSPLIISTDLENLTADNLAIISNKYLLAFNQDPNIGRPAYPYKWGFNPDWTFDPLHPAEYWSGPTSKEGVLILMMNTEDINATRTAIWSEVPELRDIEKSMKIRSGGKVGGGFNVVDVWTGQDIGCVRDNYSVELESHDAAVLMVKQPC